MNTKTKQGGLGIVSILTIVFIVLKLSGVIKWHWILSAEKRNGRRLSMARSVHLDH